MTVVIPSVALQADEIRFSRDVLPILSDHCLLCHGPDGSSRVTEMRLDLEESAREVIAADEQGQSELVRRITSTDSDTVMPPPDAVKQLSERQKRILQQWIAEGAGWEGHWAYQPVQQPEIEADRPRDAIDYFVDRRLKEAGLEPNPPAEPEEWFRRVTLDLTGLPPTPDEVDRFLKNLDYEAAVDRLLVSPRYGERMAWDWLEAARYADTHGYQKDNVRTMWAWRDWVIESFNNNQSYDQFTVEQLAGDLLPRATLKQRIATGFNRNHRINAEAGSIPEEFRTEYVIDRVDTTATVWMGMTAGCARCHDHKFDPLSQRDFYRLFAFFNNIEEQGSDGVGPAAVPDVTVPVPAKERQLAIARVKLNAAEKRLQAAGTDEEFAAWLAAHRQVSESGSFWLVTPPEAVTGTSDGSTFEILADGSVLFGGANPLNDVHEATFTIPAPVDAATLRLEALAHHSLTDGSLARSFNGDFLLSEIDVLVDGNRLRWKSATADRELSDRLAATAIDGNPLTGWSPGPAQSEATAWFTPEDRLELKAGDRVTVRLRYESREEQYMIGRFRLSLGVGSRPDAEMSASLFSALNENNQQTLVTQFRETAPAFEKLRESRDTLRREVDALQAETVTRVMVMQERKGAPRVTHLLERGLYDHPGEVVEAGVPEFLGLALPEGEPVNRLTLARWLVDPRHPLTARVAVNRFWQQIFGSGLVRTPEDFGYQGERPTHPELLDWLAADFVQNGWNVKRLLREFVLSETYRRSSAVRPDLLERDPDNHLLGRMTRLRLPAPMIRDQALHVSGLMVNQLGGPSVKPWQPDGLWEAVAGVNSNTTRYEADSDDGRFRRSLYTFWKRGMPPPNMLVFDAASRETCTVGRSTTNSPLQALTTLNDPTFAVSAIVFAHRTLRKEHGRDDAEILASMWQRVQGKDIEDRQLNVLVKLLEGHLSTYTQQPQQAAERIAPADEWVNRPLPAEAIRLAAFTEVAEVLLNLDTTLTRP